MKRIIIGISIAAVLAGVIAACLILKPQEAVEIKIEETNWCNEPGYVPTEQTRTYEVKSGDIIKCGGLSDLEVTVSRISKNSVKIKTNTPMSNSEESYVDLEASGTRFTISKDKPLRLVTPTLDAGDIYVFSIAGTDGKE